MTYRLRNCAISPVLVALVCFASLPAHANPYLVRDLALGGPSSNAQMLGSSGGRAFFLTGEVNGPRAMWSTDGTAAGTEQIAFVTTQDGSAKSLYFTDIAGTAYFVNSSSGHTEIWKTDGTTAGTMRVAASSAARMRDLTNVGGTLFFASSPDGSSLDLWKSNGTAAGTELVADIDYSGELTDIGGIAWFKATMLRDSKHGAATEPRQEPIASQISTPAWEIPPPGTFTASAVLHASSRSRTSWTASSFGRATEPRQVLIA